MKLGIGVVLLVVMALPARGQVGHAPERSPYRDLEYRREWTLFSGTFDPMRDPVGVAPRGGPMAGIRYDMQITGPLYVSGRLATAFAERRVLDPRRPNDERIVAIQDMEILLTDVSLGLNLTGFRTWRNLVPVVNAGLGFAVDPGGTNDVGGYRFGAPFTLTFGAGIKWAPGGRWQLRLDWANYIYQIRYPDAYYIDQGEGDPVLRQGDAQSLWRRNTAIQIGISWLTGR